MEEWVESEDVTPQLLTRLDAILRGERCSKECASTSGRGATESGDRSDESGKSKKHSSRRTLESLRRRCTGMMWRK